MKMHRLAWAFADRWNEKYYRNSLTLLLKVGYQVIDKLNRHNV